MVALQRHFHPSHVKREVTTHSKWEMERSALFLKGWYKKLQYKRSERIGRLAIGRSECIFTSRWLLHRTMASRERGCIACANISRTLQRPQGVSPMQCHWLFVTLEAIVISVRADHKLIPSSDLAESNLSPLRRGEADNDNNNCRTHINTRPSHSAVPLSLSLCF